MSWRAARPALVVCATLCAAVVGLVLVSLWVPGPPVVPASTDPVAVIRTAATPIEPNSLH